MGEAPKGSGTPAGERAEARRRVWSGSPWEPVVGFCRAIRVGNRVLVAGTAPVPPTGKAVGAGAYEQMLRCGEIALGAIAELGATPADIVRTRMYITDAADAEAIGRAHREVFGEANPVATMVVVARLLDPAWKVELEVEAVVD